MSTLDELLNHGLWQLGGTPPIVISSDTSFMVPPQLNSRKRGLLIQGWHYKGHVEHRTSEQQMGYFYEDIYRVAPQVGTAALV